MTIDEVAQALGLTRATILQYVCLCRLPRPVDGQIPDAAVERYRQRQATARERQKPPRLSPRRTLTD